MGRRIDKYRESTIILEKQIDELLDYIARNSEYLMEEFTYSDDLIDAKEIARHMIIKNPTIQTEDTVTYIPRILEPITD